MPKALRRLAPRMHRHERPRRESGPAQVVVTVTSTCGGNMVLLLIMKQTAAYQVALHTQLKVEGSAVPPNLIIITTVVKII